MDQSIKRREFPKHGAVKLPPNQAEAIREQYRKATEPYSGRSQRIEHSPEQLEQIRREVKNGSIPF